MVRSYREIIYIYKNCNHNFRTDHKAGAVNLGILEGELDPGDAWEIYSDSHLALVMLIFWKWDRVCLKQTSTSVSF